MDSNYNALSEEYASKPDGYYGWPRREMIPFVPKNSRRLLDVGCSGGGFGAAVKEALPDCEVLGVEPEPEAATLAMQRLDRVINAPFSPDLEELQGRTFDTICFNDVLEHVANPEKILDDCKAFLRPNGVVVASLPNILFFYQIAKILMEQDWKYEASGIMDNTHLRFFTKKSIVRLFEERGFEVLRIEGINSWSGWKYRLANILTLGRLKDWKHIQFAIVSSPVSNKRTSAP